MVSGGLTFAIPTHDNFADAVTVSSLPFTDNSSTLDSTDETDEVSFCAGISATVWYKYTPDTNQIMLARTFGSDFDSSMGTQIYLPSVDSVWVQDCVFEEITGTSNNHIFVGDGSVIEGCIIKGLAFGISVRGTVKVRNNTFYKQTEAAVRNYGTTPNDVSSVIENNIMYLTAIDDYGVIVDAANSGSIAYIGYNCVWSAGGQVTDPFYDDNRSEVMAHEGTLEENPRFADAAGGDFRLMNSSLLESGSPDAQNRRGPIGAVGTKRKNPVGLSVGSPIAGAF